MPNEIKTFDCLFGKINISCPTTVEEFDNLAGRSGAALDFAVKQVIYHKTLGDAREEIVEAAEEAFDFARLEIDTGKKTKKEGKPITVWEEPDDYVKRLFADKGWDRTNPPKEWLDLTAALEVAFDPSTKVRESKSKTLAKVYITAVESIYKAGSVAKAAGVLGVTLTGDDAADKKALGWALKAREDAKRKAAEAAMLSDLK